MMLQMAGCKPCMVNIYIFPCPQSALCISTFLANSGRVGAPCVLAGVFRNALTNGMPIQDSRNPGIKQPLGWSVVYRDVPNTYQTG